MGVSVLVMAKAPRPGAVKTRLAPLLGDQGCAALQAALIGVVGRWAEAVATPGGAYLAYGPGGAGEEELRPHAPAGVALFPDGRGDLGDRLAGATARVLGERGGPLLVVGTDMPTLAPAHARAAEVALRGGADAVFGPAFDGGYWLVGLARPAPELFDLGAAWGGPDVLARSLALAGAAGLRVELLGTERDLDDVDDARALLEHPRLPPEIAAALAPASAVSGARGARGGARGSLLVSVIVPTFDEQEQLPALLDHVEALPGAWEVILADGGSRDHTAAIATQRGVRVVAPGGGRAQQLNAAAATASGELLLFLHADSRLPSDAHASLAAAAGRAVGGNFALRFDGGDLFARALTASYAFDRRFGLYYGDSSVWATRAAFERLGGYRDLPIMDDFDFVRRLERTGRTACLPGPATTSDRRWSAMGVARTLLTWWVIRLAFLAGVSPARLARLYRRVR